MAAPLEKFKELDKNVLEREEAKEVFKVAAQLEASLTEYMEQKREEWRRDCAATFHLKLELPLLIRHPATKFHGGYLEVNFAPELVRLLREAKYFLSLGLEIPENAAALYSQVNVFRVWCENMDMMVNLNNAMLDNLLPVEKPLLKPYMDRFNASVEPGVVSLSWDAPQVEIDAFVAQNLTLVRHAHDIFSHLKHNFHKAKDVIRQWAEAPMVDRKQRPTDIKEFLQLQKAPQAKVYGLVKESSKELQQLLKHSQHELHLNNQDATWCSYVNFTSNLVVAGLGEVVSTSLTYLFGQVDRGAIKAKELQPLIEVSLDLVGGMVAFQPGVSRSAAKGGACGAR
jgi:dynein heavy chain